MIPFTTCAVYLRQQNYSSVAAYTFGRNAEQIRGRSLSAGLGIAGWVVINGRPMSNTDPMLDLSEFLESNGTGYRTAAVFPLTERGETLGALALYSNELLHAAALATRQSKTSLVTGQLVPQPYVVPFHIRKTGRAVR